MTAIAFPVSKSDALRKYIAAHGPIRPLELSRALDMPYAHVWGLCRPMVMRGILACDDSGAYTFVRDAMPPSSRKKDPSVRQEYERARAQRRAAERRAARHERGLLIRVRDKTQRQLDYDARRSEVARARRSLEHIEMAAPAEMPPETIEQWMARTGRQPERLPAGAVSPASRFKHLEVAA